jgi:hypothetical protein
MAASSRQEAPAQGDRFGDEYCNVLALQRGLDPAGHADSFEDLLLLETPLPWRSDLYQVAGVLPQQAIDLYALWLRRYEAGQPYNHRALLIAPDPEYSQPGYRRVMFYTRPPAAFAQFARCEYLVPEEQAGALVWALFEARDQLRSFECYRLPEDEFQRRARRDILVCTHGTIDVACARFGYPLYRHLRDEHGTNELRVWRASHFGGHVFAPTLMDMPSGHYWAYVTKPKGQQIVERSGDVGSVYSHLRGWAGLAEGFEQAADCELWRREGWEWFDYTRHSTIVAQDDSGDEPLWARVRIDFTRPDGASSACTALVTMTHTVATRPSTGDAHDHAYPQYAVTEIVTDIAPGERDLTPEAEAAAAFTAHP